MPAIGTLGFVEQLLGGERAYQITSSTLFLYGFVSGANYTGLRLPAGTTNYQATGGGLQYKMVIGYMHAATAASAGLIKLGWSTAAEGVDTTLAGSETFMCGSENMSIVGSGTQAVSPQCIPCNFLIPNTRYPFIKGFASTQCNVIVIAEVA